jgi:hypothetical protein
MATVATLDVKIGADLKEFQRGMNNLQQGLDRAGKQMRSVGKTLSMGLTAPLVALGAKSLQVFNQQQQALAQVESAVRSTGGAAGFAVEELAKQASALQANTIFGDEEILKNVTANLLTFTRITGDEFTKTQGLVLDLATRMGTDLTSATIQLGKALNDPVANLGALSRAGIQFTKEQKEVIKSLVEGGKQAEAQRIILDELEVQFGGAAEAAAQAGLGGFKQLQNSVGDLLESFGELMLPIVNDVVEVLRNVVDRLQAMSPEAKKTTLAIVGLAAAIGPALFILGGMAAGFSAIIGAMGTLAALANPVVLAFAAIAAIGIAVYRNWDAVTLAFNGTYTAITELVDNLKTNFVTTLSGIFGAVGLAITGKFTEAWDMLKETASAGATDVVSDLSTFATDAGAAVAPLATALVTDPFQIGDFFETGLVADITDKATSIVGDFGSVEQSVNDVDNMNPTFEGITDALQGQSVPSIVLSAFYAGQGIKGVSDQVAILEKVKPDFSNITANVAEIETKASAASIKLQEMVDELIPDELTNPYVGIIESATPEEGQIEKIGRFQERMRLLSLDLANASHHARQLDMRIGDVESAWRPLFGTDSPQWMKDLSKYASDATLIVTGLEAMVELLKPSTWTDALSVLKDLGEGLWNIVTAIGEIILKIAQWVLAQAGIGGAGPDFTGGAPGIIIPGSGGDATTTAAGGTGAGLGLLGGATFGATLGIFAWGLGQMLDNTWNSLIEQGVDPAQLGTATSLGGLLQGVGSMGGTGSGTPSWLSGLQGYMGTGGSANTSGIMGSGSMGSTQTININLDGQQIATATVPYMAGELELYGTNY